MSGGRRKIRLMTAFTPSASPRRPGKRRKNDQSLHTLVKSLSFCKADRRCSFSFRLSCIPAEHADASSMQFLSWPRSTMYHFCRRPPISPVGANVATTLRRRLVSAKAALVIHRKRSLTPLHRCHRSWTWCTLLCSLLTVSRHSVQRRALGQDGLKTLALRF